MSCNNSNCYLPIPPRAWSRVQNGCSLFDENTYSGTALVPLPYSGRLVPASSLYLEYAMLSKGNVLQYKKNSSNLTKQQRYAQIAKGQWTNRNTTWATQSTRGYTNPNNQSLQRVNSINITLDGQPTFAPVTCPKTVTPVYQPLPATSSSGANPQVIPPPPPPPTANSGTALPATIVETPVEPVVIQDLGNLICGTQENVCTGELISQLVADNCHPTSDSDVPGPIMELCWNDGNPTWYPRQRYVMTNSGNKWPVNATLLSAVKPLPAVITSITNLENVVTLTWTFDSTCLPVNDFIIYENGIPIQIVSGNIFRTSFTLDNCATYTFYIVGSNGSVVSEPSNTVSIDIYISFPPFNLSYILLSSSSIKLSWEINTLNNCSPLTSYTIYYNTSSITISSTNTTYDILGLTQDTIYNIYMTSNNDTGTSPSSNLTVTTNSIPFTITGGGTTSYSSGYYYIPFISVGSLTFINNLQNIYVAIVGGGGGGGFTNQTPRSGGGGGGGQSLIPFSTILANNIFNITSIGAAGAYGSSLGSSGSSGTSTIFLDYNMNAYTVTGGSGGLFSATTNANASSGTYSGPIISPTGNTILSGTGGYGGYNNQNGEDSYFSTLNITNNINTLYRLGGGGGGSGTAGGEGGSSINSGPGKGGFLSNTSNLNTEAALGYGAGGGAYTSTNNTPHPGNGSQGICIVFFQF